MHELSPNGKKYTVKEISEMINVSQKTIQNSIKRLFPYVMEQGKTTYLTESMATDISKDLKVSHNSSFASTGVVVMTKGEEDMVVVNAMAIMQKRVLSQSLVIEQQKPMVDSYKRLIDTGDTINKSDFAKSINWRPNKMLAKLRELKILKLDNIPYQEYIHHFIVKHGDNNGKNYQTAYFKPSSLDFISKKLGEDK